MRIGAVLAISLFSTPLALAACDRSEPASPAVATLAATPTAADPAAEAFVRSLYGPSAPEVASAVSPVWSARTAALIARTEALTAEGDMGFFEADPICDCQDGEARILELTTTQKDADHADVAIAFDYGGGEAQVLHKTYNLVREAGAWKIDNIQRDKIDEFDQAPLVTALNTWIAEAQAAPAEGAAQ